MTTRRFASRLVVALVLAAVLGPGGAPAAESTIERRVTFDAQGRVWAITRAIAQRLQLAPPLWPIEGEYVEARLYESDDGWVLVAERSDDEFERWPLDDAAHASLAEHLGRHTPASGIATTKERTDTERRTAGGAFVRNQMIGALTVYGPAAAVVFSDDAAQATSGYLLAVGATFFASTHLARSRHISSAQVHLSTDALWKGAAIGSGIAYIASSSTPSSDDYALAAFGGGLLGTVAGYRLGRSLTDGEAHGASYGSTLAAALALGAVGMAGGFQGDDARGETAWMSLGGLAGYPIGATYARRSSYAITAGDIGALSAAGAVGTLTAATFLVDRDSAPSGREVAAVLTSGLIAGTLLGDRGLVRRVDHTESEGWLVGIGAVAGGLVGAALPLFVESDDATLYVGLASAGSIVGLVATEHMVAPAPARR